ncbi:flavodoxin domain-containing protein [Candidatus Bathyarchaeota archaeon]|nr:flavodoxin domain-containing protein [Candidatus Bathyarchaeota archaeon]
MKILIIYDSNTGYTEKMAKAIAEGAASVKGTTVDVKKIGERFPLNMIAEADGVLFGSPCIYSDVTNGVKDFLEHVESYIKLGKMNLKGKKAGVFGTYGYDGAWIFEERFKVRVVQLGFDVKSKTLQLVDTSIESIPNTLDKAKTWGKEFVNSLK